MAKRNFILLFLVLLVSCVKHSPSPSPVTEPEGLLSLEDVASILSSVRMTAENMEEVHDAVSASRENGYDSEYTMASLMRNPGSGVGSDKLEAHAKASLGYKTYSNPLKNIFIEHFSTSTKAGGITAAEYMDYISGSDMQIFWPYPEQWDGHTLPVITFDPLNGRDENIGYYMDEEGVVREIMVNEEMAMRRPVWVVNNNDDARHVTLEVMRKNNPDWGSGGEIIVNPTKASPSPDAASISCLLLKSICLKRNYDSWFQGASELFFKVGSVESFSGMKEADLQLFDPSITDFVVVVRRNMIGKEVEVNTVLVSEWTSQLQNCAMMIIEDDGGTVTSWKCNAVVKINSKSYGFEIEIPYRSRDDIVWRGQLSRRYIEATDEISANFGDCQLTFDIKQM